MRILQHTYAYIQIGAGDLKFEIAEKLKLFLDTVSEINYSIKIQYAGRCILQPSNKEIELNILQICSLKLDEFEVPIGLFKKCLNREIIK
jgi:hypothetical protein